MPILQTSDERQVLCAIDSATQGEHGGLTFNEIMRRRPEVTFPASTLADLVDAGLVRVIDHKGNRTYWTTALGHEVAQAPGRAGR